MVGTSALLTQAAKEVQVADHLLTVTYVFTGDLKILFRVMAHAANAVDLVVSSVDEAGDIPTYDEALEVYGWFSMILDRHEVAPMVFRRKQRLMVASHDFDIDEVRADEVERHLKTVKQFVFHAGKHMVIQ